MQFFIASRWTNKDAVESLSNTLTEKGFSVYSYLNSGANLTTGSSIADELKTFHEAMRNWRDDQNIWKIFNSEIQHLKESDVAILLQPAGRSSMLEAGVAYGMGKRVLMIGPVDEPEMAYLIFDRLYPSAEAFLGDLDNFAKGSPQTQ